MSFSSMENPILDRGRKPAVEEKMGVGFLLPFAKAAVRSKVETSSLSPGLGWGLAMKQSPHKEGNSWLQEKVAQTAECLLVLDRCQASLKDRPLSG